MSADVPALSAYGLPPGADASARAWLEEACTAVAHDPGAVVTAFAVAGRRVGRAPLRPDVDPTGVLHGTAEDAARAALVTSLADAVLRAAGPGDLAARLTDLYRRGDTAERRGVLRGLDRLADAHPAPIPPEVVAAGLQLTADALRANEQSLVVAAVGPFAAAHLDAHAWRHAVLKLVFMGVSLDAVAALDERADAELARMAQDFAAERRAAGRAVPADLSRIAPRSPRTNETD